MEFTFKDFLLLEGGDGSGRPDDGKRPKNTLWFDNPYYWYADMHNMHGKDICVVNDDGEEVNIRGEEGEEVAISGVDNLFVVDKDRECCYGAWKKNYNKGVTFFKPRPYSVVRKKH